MQNVLAVDDSPSMRSLVDFVLKRAGYNVVLAEDGEQALAWAQDNTVDLVLTDINMPKLDGIGLIRALRAMPSYQYVPMLVLTTEYGREKKLEGKAAGATGWIVKPFEPTMLIQTISRVLS